MEQGKKEEKKKHSEVFFFKTLVKAGSEFSSSKNTSPYITCDFILSPE